MTKSGRGFTTNKEMTSKCFLDYVTLVHKWTGISIGDNRKSMLVGRIRKRIKELNLGSYEEYFLYVSKYSSEKTILIDLITTNETYFYRTPRIWNYLFSDFLPIWHNLNKGRSLKAWSAAGSSGEEALTLSMLGHEFQNKNPTFNFKIDATDISNQIVLKAQNAEYGERAVRSIKKERPDLFKKYIYKKNDVYSVESKIKKPINFYQHNLFDPLSQNPKFHLILLRNVLIYFTKSDQIKVLEKIQKNLTEDGLLVIGESESLIHLESHFVTIAPLVYVHKDNPNLSSLKAG